MMKPSILRTQMAVHPQLQQQQLFHMAYAGAAGNQLASLIQQMPPHAVYSGEPESELTCNVSSTRKRPRDEPPPLMPPTSSNVLLKNHHQQQFLLQKQLLHLDVLPDVETSRPNHSAMTSTSGRPPLAAAQPSTIATPGNNPNDDDINIAPCSSISSSLISVLNHHHSLEIDNLIRVHTGKLRSGLDEARKRQFRAAVTALEQQAQSRVAEKQAELEAAATRNAELQDRLTRAAAERQAWFSVAKNSEALVAGLRASLENVLLQKLGDCINNSKRNNEGSCAAGAAPGEAQEGYGDSEEDAAASAAVSCSAGYVEGSSTMVGAPRKNKPSAVAGSILPPCKSCGQHGATVLLLPCRHLCLCPSCDPSVADCPVCQRPKNATLKINPSLP